MAELAALGVDPRGHDIAGIRYLDAGGAGPGVSARFAAGPGRGVRRTVLHAALAEQLAAAGVARRARARSVRSAQGTDHVEVDGERARYLVAADGLHSPTRRLLGLEAGAPAGRRRFGLRCHVQQAPWTSFVEVHWSPRAEAYVTPVDDDLVGVAVLTDTGEDFDDALADFPLLRERLVGAAHPGPGRRPAAPAGPRPGHADGCCSSATPAGYVDALTGEGIALGLAQARAAVACLAAGRARALRAAGPPDRAPPRGADPRAARARPAARPCAGCWCPAAERLPWVFSTAVNQLARPDRGARMTPRRAADRRPSPWCCSTRTGRAVGTADKAAGAPRRHPAAPRVLLLPLRRRRRRAGHPPCAAQADLPRRVDQQLLRPPRPGEPLADAVRRRVAQELGTEVVGLRLVLPRFRYRAEQDGVVENEMCPVFVGTAAGDVTPDPDEVAEARWEPWAAFRDGVLDGTREVSVWCREQVAQLPADLQHAPTASWRDLPEAARSAGGAGRPSRALNRGGEPAIRGYGAACSVPPPNSMRRPTSPTRPAT